MSLSPIVGRLTFRLALRCVLSAVLLTVAYASARAQGSGGTDMIGNGGKHSIRGRIYFPSGRRSDMGLKIRLVSTGFGDATVLSDANGSFSFQSLRPGSYYVVIEGDDNYETVREQVVIESDNSMMRGGGVPSVPRPYTVQIYLQPKSAHVPTARPGVLNAALAGVPKPAVELYEKATESARAGHDDKAVEQLRAALAIYPNFALALSEMGVLYMKLKEPEKAAETLREALKLVPDDYATILTYAIALHDSRQFLEAESEFRKVARKNPSASLPHYYLGVILIRRHEFEEAERELKSAIEVGGDEVPRAHYYLGGVYWNRHAYKQAADELETYLKLVPNAEDAPRLRASIKEFRSKK
jgi:Flp pilus assembly protein TadD